MIHTHKRACTRTYTLTHVQLTLTHAHPHDLFVCNFFPGRFRGRNAQLARVAKRGAVKLQSTLGVRRGVKKRMSSAMKL